MKIEEWQEQIPEDIMMLIKAIALRFSKEGELSCPYICWMLRKEIYRKAYDSADGNMRKASRILGVCSSTAARYYQTGRDV